MGYAGAGVVGVRADTMCYTKGDREALTCLGAVIKTTQKQMKKIENKVSDNSGTCCQMGTSY